MPYTIQFSCILPGAHKLSLPYNSPCNELHGHTYRIELQFQSETLTNGMVIDFTRLKDILAEFDHCDWNEYLDNPTSERIAKFLYHHIKQTDQGIVSDLLQRVTVYEGQYNAASFYA